MRIWHWPAPTEASAEPVWPYLNDPAQIARLSAVMKELRAKHGAKLRSMDVLQFHGNAGSRENRLPWMQLIRGLGCSVTVLDYRGFGGSSGSPTEVGLIADGAAAYAWLRGASSSSRSSRRRRMSSSGGSSRSGGPSYGVRASALESLSRSWLTSRQRQTARSLYSRRASPPASTSAQAYPFLPVRLGMLDRFERAARAQARRQGRGGPPGRLAAALPSWRT